MSENKGIAGLFVMGDVPNWVPKNEPTWPFTSVEDLRRFVRAEVRAELDSLARELATDRAFQTVHTPQLGTCWACGLPGDAMEWHGHHLIHATEECRTAAAGKPETREHRG